MALRSTKKEVRDAIRKEIADSFEVRLDGYDEPMPDRLPDQARFYLATLRSEFSYTVPFYEDGRQNPFYLSDQGRVLKDLNSGGPWECGTYERWLQVKVWLQQTDEEAEKYDDCDGDERWQQLIAREVMALTRMK